MNWKDWKEEQELKKRKCCSNCKSYHKGDSGFSGYCTIFAHVSNMRGTEAIIKKYGAIKNRFYCYFFIRLSNSQSPSP